MNDRKILWNKEWLEGRRKEWSTKEERDGRNGKEKWLYKKRIENTWGAKVFPAELTTQNLTKIRTVFFLKPFLDRWRTFQQPLT